MKSTASIRFLIIAVSLAIPILVTILFFQSGKSSDVPDWIQMLPHLNAAINSLTAIVLIVGLAMIRRNRPDAHKTAMLVAFSLGTVFLVSYVIYHANAPSTVFGDVNGDGLLDDAELGSLGGMRSVYLIILLSHILLAVVVVPLVLMALYFALSAKLTSHKKVVKFAFPIWLYVSVSGVIVYFLISPYY